MKIAAVAIALITSATPGIAATVQDFSGTYFCADEMGGGIAWDEDIGAWRSTVFNAKRKFVLTVRYFGPDTSVPTGNAPYDLYEASLAEMGDVAHPCSDPRDFGLPRILQASSYLICESGLTHYSFNFAELRYLASYQIGYVTGLDNNENTPSMMAGTCAKVQ